MLGDKAISMDLDTEEMDLKARHQVGMHGVVDDFRSQLSSEAFMEDQLDLVEYAPADFRTPISPQDAAWSRVALESSSTELLRFGVDIQRANLPQSQNTPNFDSQMFVDSPALSVPAGSPATNSNSQGMIRSTSWSIYQMSKPGHMPGSAIVSPVKSLLTNSLPEVAAGLESFIVPPDALLPPQMSRHNLPKVLGLILSNNFAGLGEESMGKVLKYFKTPATQRLFASVDGRQAPLAEALAESVFLAAIEADDVHIIRALIRSGVDPNKPVCKENGQRYTPIERSSMLRHIEITRLLIEAKVDLSKTYNHGTHGEHGALQCAIPRRWEFRKLGPLSPEGRKIVRMLLDASAKVDTQVIYSALYRRDTELVETFISSYSSINRIELVEHNVIIDVIEKLNDEEAAIRIIKTILKGCPTITNVTYPKASVYLLEALELATKHGNMKLVRLLIKAGARPSGITLIHAIQSGNKELTRNLLDSGIDVDCPAYEDTTPLAEAIRMQDTEVIEILKQKGALANITEKYRFLAALVSASTVGDINFVKKLLAIEAPVEETHLTGALLAALQGRHDDIALILLNSGANPNEGRTDSPLSEALRRKDPKLVRYLLNANADIHRSSRSRPTNAPLNPLSPAVHWGDKGIVADLIYAGVNVNYVGDTFEEKPALTIAVKNKNRELIEMLLDAGADVNNPHARLTKGATALAAAVENDDLPMTQYLISMGADSYDLYALFTACSPRTPNLEMVLTLVNAFTQRYPKGKKRFGASALQAAIENKNNHLIDILVKVADINSIGSFSRTPLGEAIVQNQGRSLAIVQKLLDAGGDPNSIVADGTRYRQTALLTAIKTYHLPIVELLVNAGANINQPAAMGLNRTPLQYATEKGCDDIVKFLLSKKADVNAAPAFTGGGTALQLAAIKGWVGTVYQLLSAGADVNAPPAKIHGRTAMEGAAENGRFPIVNLLLRRGVERSGFLGAIGLAESNGHFAIAKYLRQQASANV